MMIEGKIIVYTIFYTIVGALMAIILGPAMITNSKEINIDPVVYQNINAMNITTHVANKKDVRVTLATEQDTIFLQFFINENKHNALTQLLYKNGLSQNQNDFPKNLPINYNKKDLAFINNIEVLYSIYNNKARQLDYFAINGEKIKGDIPFFRKYATITFGYLIIAVSILGFILAPLSGYYQFKTYQQKGIKPTIPNRWEGLKHFFNLFKTNK